MRSAFCFFSRDLRSSWTSAGNIFMCSRGATCQCKIPCETTKIVCCKIVCFIERRIWRWVFITHEGLEVIADDSRPGHNCWKDRCVDKYLDCFWIHRNWKRKCWADFNKIMISLSGQCCSTHTALSKHFSAKYLDRYIVKPS